MKTTFAILAILQSICLMSDAYAQARLKKDISTGESVVTLYGETEPTRRDLRIVGGKLYDANRSILWQRLRNVVITVEQTPTNIATINFEPEPDGFSTTPRAGVVFHGKVLSVIEGGCLIRGRIAPASASKESIAMVLVSGDETTFFVAGLKGFADEEKATGTALLEDETFSYQAVTGAKKTVRRLRLKEFSLSQTAGVYNLDGKVGTKIPFLWSVMQVGTTNGYPIFDCGIPYSEKTKSLLTNNAAAPKSR